MIATPINRMDGRGRSPWPNSRTETCRTAAYRPERADAARPSELRASRADPARDHRARSWWPGHGHETGGTRRTARPSVGLGGRPVRGISVFAALDDIGPASLDGILAGKLPTYRVVHLVTAGTLATAGFSLLPTFGRPHMTLLLDGQSGLDPLLEVLGPGQPNPRYGEMVRRRRG